MKKLKHLKAFGLHCSLGNEGINKLTQIIKLKINNNQGITNVNHLIHLEKLYVTWYSKINNNGIKNLNLILLDAAGNSDVKEINHMTNLKILNASSSCGITNEDIKQLNLYELIINDNENITEFAHMTNLIKLNGNDINKNILI